MHRREFLICAATSLSATIVAPAHAAQPRTTAVPRIGWHIPWAAGGPRLDASGHLFQHPGEWPAFPVHALRLWDTRTAWLNLQPRRDLWDFSHLDAHLARAFAAGVEHITLVLAGTPAWAARSLSTTDAPWLGPGSASPAADIGDWEAWVSAVAHRYRSRIHAYEILNEPNLRMFWNGTYAELGAYVAVAARAIRGADPAAAIVAPAPLITQPRDVVHARRIWSVLAGAPIDALAFHFYPKAPGHIASLPQIVGHLRRAAREADFDDRPIWMTEANPGTRGTAADLDRIVRASHVAGVSSIHWYAWMQGAPAHLLPLA